MWWCLLMFALIWPRYAAGAETYNVTPTNYRKQLRALQPGDTMMLTPGIYRRGLPIHRLNGRAGAKIVISGPPVGTATLLARKRHNTISIVGSSHVVLRQLRIEANGMQVDAVKAEGGRDCQPSHHITLDSLTINGDGQGQQNVGISTKCATWGWIIRNSVISRSGTGLYLGNSRGDAPFVGGLIENNLILDSIGYGMQIKHQRTWDGEIPAHVSAPRTIIRGNTFLKTARSSQGKHARPNLLVGHPPPLGRGKDSYYDIHSNVFVDNPGEALFQGEGNIALYNNIMLNTLQADVPAVAIQPHNDIPRTVRIFRNTIVSPGTCIRIISAPGIDTQHIVANVLLCDTPIIGGRARNNVSAPYALADQYLNNPYGRDGLLDAYPKKGAVRGAPRAIPNSTGLDAVDVDFNGTRRTGAFAGALAGEGVNPNPIRVRTHYSQKSRQ